MEKERSDLFHLLTGSPILGRVTILLRRESILLSNGQHVSGGGLLPGYGEITASDDSSVVTDSLPAGT